VSHPGPTDGVRRSRAKPERPLGAERCEHGVKDRDAHRFYERLGFTGSHVGFKLQL
jgi:hypothetical protein